LALSALLLTGLAMALLLLSHCAVRDFAPTPSQEILNSERIERQFGSYGIEIVEQNARRRVSDLYSGTGHDRATRTRAVVEFVLPIDPDIESLHEAILQGASIGATFKAAGWAIRKRMNRIGEAAPKQVARETGWRLSGSGPIAWRRYRFDVRKAEKTVAYAWITEYYDREYLTLRQLKRPHR
jgi:hypothetical protein